VIGDLIEEHGLSRGAEIGVGTGPTTAALMERFPDLNWLAVDYWPAGLPLHYGGELNADQQAERREKFMRIVARYPERLDLLEMPSVAAAEHVADGSLDLVFIDADHSYEGCKADILAWRSKVRPGGWLMGHDYHKGNFPGVVQAVDELVPGARLDVDDVWLVRKPEGAE
jgi:trans-aconitate methyltransferase